MIFFLIFSCANRDHSTFRFPNQPPARRRKAHGRPRKGPFAHPCRPHMHRFHHRHPLRALRQARRRHRPVPTSAPRRRDNKKSGQLFRIVRFSSGRRTRTSDLRVMSPTSCQLLHPAIYLLILRRPAGLRPIPFYRLCECKDKSKKSLLQIIFSVRTAQKS